LASIMGLFPILVGVLSLVGSVRDAGHGRNPVRSDLQSAPHALETSPGDVLH
jgi:hypothetical protein